MPRYYHGGFMTQTTPNYPQTRHGFTLTELAIVLAIMGTILGAIWGAVSSTQKARKLSRAEQQITSTLLALTTNLNQNIGYFTPYPWGGRRPHLCGNKRWIFFP
jgi:prepilin-type N-terminal cleavage/methylation domain-containing protein